MKKSLAFIAAIAFAFAVCASAADAIKVKVAYMPPELTPEECVETTIAYAFRDYLEKHFPGRFNVELYPAGQLGSYPETFAGVSDGSIEIAQVNVAVMASADKSLNVWQIPGSVTSLKHIRRLLTDPKAMATFDNVCKKTNTTILMGYSAGARHFTNNVRQIKTPADMNGIVMRTMENPLYVKMVESIGGVAVPLASSEMYSALQNKVIEGQENPIASIIADLTYQVQNNLTLDGHVYSIAFFIANTPWLNSLPAELQEAIKAASKVGFEASNYRVDKLEQDGLEFLKKQGMTVYKPTDAELEQWHKACYDGAIGYIEEQLGKETVENFMKIVNSTK